MATAAFLSKAFLLDSGCMNLWVMCISESGAWFNPMSSPSKPQHFGPWQAVNVSWLFWRATYHEWEMVFKRQQGTSVGPASLYFWARKSLGKVDCMLFTLLFLCHSEALLIFFSHTVLQEIMKIYSTSCSNYKKTFLLEKRHILFCLFSLLVLCQWNISWNMN